MEQIKVSIVTIVRNDYKKIEHTMNSVLQQTFGDFEYIIKDGMSTDGTLDKVSKVMEEYPQRVTNLISIADNGIYDAMNQSVKYCNGRWIIFINSGDTFHNSEVLEKVFMGESEFYNFGILYGDAIVRDESGDMVWKADLNLIKKKMPFCHQSCFIKRDLLLKFPFDTEMKIAADYNNILELYIEGVNFFNLNRIVSVFELNGVSTVKFVLKSKEKNMVLKKNGCKYKRYPELLLELILEYIKEIMIKVVPSNILIKFKVWYKRYVKKYSEVVNK